MSKKEYYNWWNDPKNKEKVEELSWWNHEENKVYIEIPISVLKDNLSDGKEVWVASFNDDTKKYLNENIFTAAQGYTMNEAIDKLFEISNYSIEYYIEKYKSYERFVPFLKGDWNVYGGKWFVMFGLGLYFRYGRKNKGGFFIPFTELNVTIINYWKTYKLYLENKKQNK
jgi:hypothetical protein